VGDSQNMTRPNIERFRRNTARRLAANCDKSIVILETSRKLKTEGTHSCVFADIPMDPTARLRLMRAMIIEVMARSIGEGDRSSVM